MSCDGQTNYVTLNNIQQAANGVAAQISGIPFNVYRLKNTVSGDYVQSATLLYPDFKIDRKIMKRGDLGFESSIQPGTYWFNLNYDARLLRVGDVCVLNDPVFGTGFQSVNFSTPEFVGFCIASEIPLALNIGARIDRFASLYRPAKVPAGRYSEPTVPNLLPAVCTNGVFAYGTAGATPSKIPIGFQPNSGAQGYVFKQTPNMPEQSRFRVYFPPLPGLQPQEGDKFITADGAQYLILNPYEQKAGTSGSQFICSREIGAI